MLYNTKEGKINTENASFDYIQFGTGKKTLIMIQGLNTNGIKGAGMSLAYMYRMFAKEYTVYAFSRKTILPQSYTTRDMARDQKEAMEILKISSADVMGVSMGGMIAQHLAADYPEKVKRLVLVVTAARSNPILEEAVQEWIDCVEKDDHTALMDSNLRRIYSNAYYRRNRWMIPIIGRLTKPETYDRFLVQAQACLEHDAWKQLTRIQAPTLVIGGEQDQSLGGDASREIAGQIPGAQLCMYQEYGHGLYEEAKDFNARVLEFLIERDK